MKLFKFYKNNCAPCYALDRLLLKIGLPEGVELVSLNISDEKNLKILKEKEIDKVPVLMFEDGRTLVGAKPEKQIKEFLYK